jgi:hypothetical protein
MSRTKDLRTTVGIRAKVEPWISYPITTAPTEVKDDLHQTDHNSYSVTYDLFETFEVLRYPGGGEDRRKVELTGTIDPIPEGLESPSGPHILEMDSGRKLRCFLDQKGKLKCQDQLQLDRKAFDQFRNQGSDKDAAYDRTH